MRLLHALLVVRAASGNSPVDLAGVPLVLEEHTAAPVEEIEVLAVSADGMGAMARSNPETGVAADLKTDGGHHSSSRGGGVSDDMSTMIYIK